MSTPEDLGPERLEQLLAGAPPRDEAERELVALFARVRSAEPPAGEGLRARIASLGDPAPAPAGPLARLRAGLAGAGASPGGTGGRARRRLLAVGAPLAAAAVAAAIVLPVALRDDAPPATEAVMAGDAGAEALLSAPAAPEAAAPPDQRSAAPESAAPAPGDPPADAPAAAPAAEPAPERAAPSAADAPRALTARLVLRAPAGTAPATTAARAAAVVAAAGGTPGAAAAPGGDGTVRATHRLPADALDATLDRLARLGTTLTRDVAGVDLAPALAQAQERVDRAARRAAALRARAAAAPASPAAPERLRRARADLRRAEAALAARRARAATAVLRLVVAPAP